MIPISYKGESDPKLREFCTSFVKNVNKWIGDGHIGRGQNRVYLNSESKHFLSKFDDIDKIWHHILTPAEKLKDLITDFESEFQSLSRDRKNKKLNNYDNISTLSKCLEIAFGNNGYDSTAFPRVELLNDLDVRVCPYCNRNYISHVSIQADSVISGGHLDHFFPKSLYPYLAICRNNLVPSCSTCNVICKRDIDPLDINIVSPYELGDSFLLNFAATVSSGYFVNLDQCANSIKISINQDENGRYDLSGNVSLFHLQEMYSTHRDVVADLYYKGFLKRNGTFLRVTKNMLRSKGLTLSPSDIYRIYPGIVTGKDEIKNTPLSKFKYDLAKQFKLIP